MRIRLLVGLVSATVAPSLLAQADPSSHQWYIGVQGGVLGFGTRVQDRSWVPTVGGSLLVTAKRTGLLVTVDEALGSGEATGYTDVTTESGIRAVSFNHIRRYSAILTGYPIRSRSRPYVGLGFGLSQVIRPAVGGVFSSDAQAAAASSLASNKSTTGHFLLLAGLEGSLGPVMGFVQYQLASSPRFNQLLQGAIHGGQVGVRFSLGSAREGIHGGGY